MSLPVNQLYEFGEYRLDTREKILLRGGKAVELTPKVFELLSVLVENHGRLLEKDDLMDRIWAGSFVEESNLTFTVRQLRKTLGDDAHRPKYIKTVRQHGYRFIADVREISAEAKTPVKQPAPPAEEILRAETINEKEPAAEFHFRATEAVLSAKAARAPKGGNFYAPLLFTALVLLAGAVVIASWYARNKSAEPHAPVLNAPYSSEKLSANDRVYHAVISPDGKLAAYSNGLTSDRQSIWLRNLEDGSSVEIIPPSDETYGGIKFSPDGKFLYFARRPRETGERMTVYRVPVFGGIPQKIIYNAEGWISLSPDGAKISFVRCLRRDDDYCSLLTADSADGKNERKLITRQIPFRISDNRFSPDGKRIAFAVGQSNTASNEFALAEVDLETGAERELSQEKFFNIKNLAWLPDQSGLLMTASRVLTKNFRIWQVSLATGEAVPLTKDSESYAMLTLDKEATRLVATQVRQNFRLRLLSAENPAASRFLTDAFTVNFAPDGKLYFSSMMSGNDEIWSINPDGTGRRQLTNHEADDASPVISPDNSSVFFISNRSGAAQVWRMNTDGSDQTQITRQEGGSPLFVSPDNEWVYYRHSLTGTLRRASVKSGEEQPVLDKKYTTFAASPDFTRIAFAERQAEETVLAIAALADGRIIENIHLADKKARLTYLVWMPDGKHLAYATANQEFENNILWMLPLDDKTPRRIAVLGDELLGSFGISVSPDGKTFAFTQGEWLHNAVLFKGLR